jgi:hypothetical protein
VLSSRSADSRRTDKSRLLFEGGGESMTYRCPVCGFDRMPFPPVDNNICSCCGTEFGYHDVRFSHAELRRRWQQRGAPWFSRLMPPPVGWNPTDQINRLLLTGVEAFSNAQGLLITSSVTIPYSVRSPRRKRGTSKSISGTGKSRNRYSRASSSPPDNLLSALLAFSRAS